MKLIISFLTVLFVLSSAWSQNYPDIDPSAQFVKSDFKEIDSLMDIGQPNKAIAKILIVQIMAISTENLVDLQACYDRLKLAIPNSGKEDSDIQTLIFEQHKLFLKSKNVSRNIAALALYEWTDYWRIRQSFSYDDESLTWPTDGKSIVLENNDLSPLRDYYHNQILYNEENLMRVSSKNFLEGLKSDYFPTLFDVLAHKRIQEHAYEMSDNACDFLSTSEFSKQDLTEEYRLMAKLEVLNRRYKRWDAYAYCVENRISLCDASGKEKEREKFFETIQKDLLLVPASNRFAVLRAAYFARIASEANWRYPTENDDGFIRALEIIEQALALHPKSDFTEELKNLKKKIFASSLSFNIENNGHPSKNKLLSVQYRNLNSAHFAVYHVLKNIKSETRNPLQNFELKLIKEYQFDFDADPKMRSHTKDFILSDLDESGEFLLVSAPDKKGLEKAFAAIELNDETQIYSKVIRLTNLVVRNHEEKDGFGILVNNAITGKPVSGAKVVVEPRYKYEQGGISSKGETDAKGYYKITGSKNFKFTVTYNDDSLNSEGYYSISSDQNQRRHKVYTDRSIYRPGQEVYFKTLSYDEKSGEGTVWKAKNIKLTFTDENDNNLYEEVLITSQFGSAAGSFVLPKRGFPLGSIDIFIDQQWIRSIQVEEYKRPTFEVTFDKPKGRVVLGEKFTMTGTVAAYAGYPITNAEVRIDVSESRFFPYWCFVMDEWRLYDTTITVQTDKDGVFTFDYISNKPKDAYAVYYNFDAVVVDISGETQTANHSMYLGKNAYTISPAVKEKYKVGENEGALVEVYNSQYDKQENVKVKYVLNKLDQSKWYLSSITEAEFKNFTRKEYERKFKNTRYFGDHAVAYEKIKMGEVISGQEVALSSLAAGNYRIDFSTVDEIGDTIYESAEFIVWNPDSKRKQHLSQFWVEAEDHRPDVNETTNIYIGSSYKKARLLTAIYNENGLVSMDYKKIRKRKKQTHVVSEANKTGLAIYHSIVVKGYVLAETSYLTPVDSSKILKLKLKSIQEPLRPGTPQSWEVEISQGGKSVNNAELLASMYDASLDAFSQNYWQTNLLYKPSIRAGWYQNYFSSQGYNLTGYWQQGSYFNDMIVTAYRAYYGGGTYFSKISGNATMDKLEVAYDSDGQPGGLFNYQQGEAPPAPPVMEMDPSEKLKENTEGKAPKAIRENFNETAFFEPQIRVSADGTYKWNFTLPDALTRWKLMTFAHTPDFKTAYDIQTFQARKELMLETFEPRFWKKGDELFWVGKVVNLSDKAQTVEVSLTIQNLMDESDVSAQFGNFQKQTITLQPNESKSVEWPILITQDCPTLVRFEAEASTPEFSDIVRKTMPILENKERITLAQNFTFSEAGNHDLSLKDIKNVSEEATVQNYSVTVQTQPLWSTMLSLTHVIQPTNDLNESYFGQYFGASLAQAILKEHPEMKQALKAWQVGSEDALTSLLEQNEELKALLLAETPWALEGKNDTEQLRRLGQLLNDDFLARTIEEAWSKLKELQLPDGTWSWVGRDRPSIYMTQYFTKGIVQLKDLGIQVDTDVLALALQSLDAEYKRRYNSLTKKAKEDELGLSTMEIEWLYIRSSLNSKEDEVSKYYAKILEKNWTKFSLNTQAIIAAYAISTSNFKLSDQLMASFEDRAQRKKNLGMYWNKNLYGYGWYENDLQTQAMLIHFYTRYRNKEEKVADMQKWLLQQKRTQMWDSPKSTAMACYALMDYGKGNVTMTATVQFSGAAPQTVSASNPFDKMTPTEQNLNTAKAGAQLTTSSSGLVFASAQVVYTDKATNISKSTGDFRMERHYYTLEKGEEVEISEERAMQVGDIVRVKLKLISDRELDFVYIEDPKAAGWEPIEVLSGYHYDNAYYYLSNRDSKTEIFIENLRKGTYVFEYDLKVTVKGKLQVGPAKVSCYYAPSFSANTQGIVFDIKQ